MRVHICKDIHDIHHQVAKQIIDLVHQKPDAVLGLATGSSPLGVYQSMIKDHTKHHTDYRQVTTFNLDEYIGIAADQPQSYYQYMRQNLFDHINIQIDNIHIPQGDVMRIEDECHRFNQLLKQYSIDMQLLGLGSNGHIGFNEPGTPFDCTTHIIKLDQKTRQDNARFFASIEDVPTHAITMGIANIMAAKSIILIATGERKQEAVHQMVMGKQDTLWPCTVLQNHPSVDVYLDQKAAALLQVKAVTY